MSVKLGNIGDTVAVGVWPIPDSSLPHTQLERSKPKYGAESQAHEWQHGSHGQLQPTRDTDFSDHRTPSLHPNPRRRSGSGDDWDSTWVQSVDSAPFHEQVSWELTGIERADVVIVYLDPATRAPISLLELGLIAVSGRALVCCPDGYFRKGNVDVVCQRYRVPQARDLEELIALARERLTAG